MVPEGNEAAVQVLWSACTSTEDTSTNHYHTFNEYLYFCSGSEPTSNIIPP